MKTIEEKLESAQEKIGSLKKEISRLNRENMAFRHLISSKQKVIQKAANENQIKDIEIETVGKWIGYLSHKLSEEGTEHQRDDLRYFIDNYDTRFRFDEKSLSYVIKTVKKTK